LQSKTIKVIFKITATATLGKTYTSRVEACSLNNLGGEDVARAKITARK
jgi:hypothetical protein